MTYLITRFLFWIFLMAAVFTLAVGPARLKRGLKRFWAILWRKEPNPEEILSQIVSQHEQHVKAVKSALAQAERAEAAIADNLKHSEARVAALEMEAASLAEKNDDEAARAALYKLNLEKTAIDSFREQLERQQSVVAESKLRLYLLELQLRQYEVGRSVLLSQLAQAENVEEQFAIARQFDPFHAIADWKQAEGLVHEKSLNAKAIERVYADTSDMSAAGAGTPDPVVLEAQLAALQAQLQKARQLPDASRSSPQAIAKETTPEKSS